MARLKFEMFVDEWSAKNTGISSRFTDGAGRTTVSWWSAPPNSISHVDITYLQGRYGNVRTERHEAFIKEEFEKQMKLFDFDGSRYKRIDKHLAEHNS